VAGQLAAVPEVGLRGGEPHGHELLAERAGQARTVLPSGITVFDGDASSLALTRRFDIVYRSTVLSSILADELQTAMAGACGS